MKLQCNITVDNNGSIEELAWAPDGSRLAALSFPPPEGSREGIGEAGLVQIYDTAIWQVIQTLPTPITRSKAWVAWSPDRQRLATVSSEGVTIWEVEMGQVLSKLQPAEGETYSVAWSPKGNYLAASLIDAEGLKITVWDLSSGAMWRTLLVKEGGGGGIAWMAWSPRDAYLAALALEMKPLGDASYNIIIWNPAGGQILHVLPVPPGIIEGFGQSHGWSPDGGLIAIATGLVIDRTSGEVINQGKITIWDMTSGQVSSTIFIRDMSLSGAAWSADCALLASTTGEEILIFDPKNGKLVHILSSLFPEEEALESGFQTYITTKGFTRSFAWSPNGKALVAGNVGGMKVWTFEEHGR